MSSKLSVFYKGVDFDVEFDFDKGDPGVWTYANGDPGYPAVPPSIEIVDIRHNGVDFWELLEFYMDDIEELIWKDIDNG